MGMKHIASEYEPKNFTSFKNTVKPGQVVFDIGAYDGITSVLAAQAVGPPNVVIIEPAEMNWATIRAYWQAHELDAPRATYAGFVSDMDKIGLDPKSVVTLKDFPAEADRFPVAQEEEGLNFRLLDDRSKYPEVAARPNLKLDTIAAITGAPDAITMDIEGAELVALLGAVDILREHHPQMWISIHPKFMVERFNHSFQMLRNFLMGFGYRGTLLANDHEEHWQFV